MDTSNKKISKSYMNLIIVFMIGLILYLFRKTSPSKASYSVSKIPTNNQHNDINNSIPYVIPSNNNRKPMIRRSNWFFRGISFILLGTFLSGIALYSSVERGGSDEIFVFFDAPPVSDLEIVVRMYADNNGFWFNERPFYVSISANSATIIQDLTYVVDFPGEIYGDNVTELPIYAPNNFASTERIIGFKSRVTGRLEPFTISDGRFEYTEKNYHWISGIKNQSISEAFVAFRVNLSHKTEFNILAPSGYRVSREIPNASQTVFFKTTTDLVQVYNLDQTSTGINVEYVNPTYQLIGQFFYC
jgi:hypothetical protein